MKVTVKCLGRLGRTGPQSERDVHLPEGSTVAHLIGSLELRPGQVWLATVNGRFAEDDQPLQPGDQVVLIPPVGGGE